MEACLFTHNEVLGLFWNGGGRRGVEPWDRFRFLRGSLGRLSRVVKWPSSIRVAVRGTGHETKGKPPWLHGLGRTPPQENQKAGLMFGIGHYSFKMHPVHSDEIEFSDQHHQHLFFLSLSRPPWFNGSNHWDVTRQENGNSGYAGRADRAQRCLWRWNAAGSGMCVQSSGNQCGSYRRHRGWGAHKPQLAAREPTSELYSGGSRSSSQWRAPLWHRGRLQVKPGPVIFLFTIVTRQRQGEGLAEVKAPFLLLSSYLHGHRAVSQQILACEGDLRLDPRALPLLLQCSHWLEELSSPQPVSKQMLPKSWQEFGKSRLAVCSLI